MFMLSPAGAYEEQISRLSNDLIESFSTDRVQKIGVVDFTDLDGKSSHLSRFIAEELSVDMTIKADRFEVVDRHHLKKVLDELSLGHSSGLFDPEQVREVGRMSGADAIVTGTVTPHWDNVRVTAKIISTESGKVLGAARTKIPKTITIERLLKKSLEGGEAEAETEPEADTASKETGYGKEESMQFQGKSGSGQKRATVPDMQQQQQQSQTIRFMVGVTPWVTGEYAANINVWIDNRPIGTISNVGNNTIWANGFRPGNHTYQVTAELYSLDVWGNQYFLGTAQGSGSINAQAGDQFMVQGSGNPGIPGNFQIFLTETGY
jgi:TolB-like protein